MLARAVALTWLLAVAPFELASALATLASGPWTPLTPSGAAIIAIRVAVTAAGLVLGRAVLARRADVMAFAVAWAVADLASLAVVLATRLVPTNRAPGTGVTVWLVYLAAAAVVTMAAASARASGPDD